MATNLPFTDASRSPTASPTFPMKLHLILTSAKWNDIIKFEADGNKWKVVDKKRMEEEVLPLIFRHNRYLSFSRSVIGWGFKRVGKATYYHKLFTRDDPNLCSGMRRKLASNDKLIHRPDTDRNHRCGILSGSNRSNAYQTCEGHEGIPRPNLRLHQDTPILHPTHQVMSGNMFPFGVLPQSEAVTTVGRHHISQGMLQTGMSSPVQYDKYYQLRNQYLGMHHNSPDIYHNRQGVPITPILQDCMYQGPVIHLPYYLPLDQNFNNGQN